MLCQLSISIHKNTDRIELCERMLCCIDIKAVNLFFVYLAFYFEAHDGIEAL